MSRRAVAIVMLIAMLWQSVAMARIGSTVNVLADPAHAALHWHEEGHHHHDDGTYHLGDPAESAESAQHLQGDPVSATTALPVTGLQQGFAAPGSAAPDAVHQAHVPNPILDGLLRPPRSRS